MRPLEKVLNDTYSMLPFKILINGHFDEIAVFANGLEQSQQLIKISSLNIFAPDEIGRSYSLSAVLEIQVLKINSRSGWEEE
jgi:Tfp pilus assembly protein PilO